MEKPMIKLPKPGKITSIFTPKALGALGVLSAGLLLSEVNITAARQFERWDVSANHRFSLHDSSRRIVSQLRHPVDIFILMGSGDPLLSEVRQSLESYQALSKLIRVHHIDPDRDVVEFLALANQYDIGSESISSAGVKDGASLLITSQGHNWFLRSGQLTGTDSEGNTISRIESEITEGIARTQKREPVQLCFTTGHGELSVDDSAPEGLIELQRRLSHSNIEVKRVPLDIPDPARALDSCDAIAVVGPGRPWSQDEGRLLVEAFKKGAGLLLFIDPIVGESGDIMPSGLHEVFKAAGVISSSSFVLEKAPEQRLPAGIGEAFFAQPKTHPLTQGLSSESARLDARVLVVAAQPLTQAPGAPSVTLLQTSKQAASLQNLSNERELTKNSSLKAPFSLAMAQELPGKKGTHPTRTVVVGTSNLAWNRSFKESTLYGNRVFVENAFSWVLDNQPLVSIPPSTPLPAGLTLTETSLQELLLYVLVYMPLAAASAGALVLFRRKRSEEIARKNYKGSH